MPRPNNPRCIRFHPDVYYFKPRGIPMSALQEVILQPDELEALKLYEVDGFDQTASARKMNISQPTFARILGRSHHKVANAIIKGYAIKIETKKNDK